MYTDQQLVEKCRQHACHVNPGGSIDDQTIARLAQVALNLAAGYHLQPHLDHLLLHLSLPRIPHDKPDELIPPPGYSTEPHPAAGNGQTRIREKP